MTNIDNWRREICEIGRRAYEKGYLAGYEGNISIRIAPDQILITPSGLHKGFLKPHHLIVIDSDGKRIDEGTAENKNLRPSSESPMHTEAYKQRDDIKAVVHAHPPHAITCSIAGIPIADDLIPEVVVLLGRIPVTPYATPSSTENADAIRAVIAEHSALVLERHGSLSVGQSVMEAFMRLETIESAAKISYMLAQLGVESPIPPHQLEKLRAQRERLLTKGSL